MKDLAEAVGGAFGVAVGPEEGEDAVAIGAGRAVGGDEGEKGESASASLTLASAPPSMERVPNVLRKKTRLGDGVAI